MGWSVVHTSTACSCYTRTWSLSSLLVLLFKVDTSVVFSACSCLFHKMLGLFGGIVRLGMHVSNTGAGIYRGYGNCCGISFLAAVPFTCLE